MRAQLQPVSRQIATAKALWYWLIASLAALIGSAILLAQTPEFWMQSWIWDNEKLLPFDHLVLASQGANILAMNLARIPSLVPDYIVAAFSRLISDDIRKQALAYILIISSAQILLASLLLARVVRLSLFNSIPLIVVTSFGLGFVCPVFALNHSLASLPMNHGGNLFLVFLLMLLVMRASALTHAKANSSQQILIFVICLAGALSNRMFILQASLPGLVVLARPLHAANRQACSRHRRAMVALILGSALGLLFSNGLIRTGCTPPRDWDTNRLIMHIQELFILRSDALGVGWIMAAALAICLAFLVRSLRQKTSDQTTDLCLFMILSAVFTLLVYPFIFTNQGSIPGRDPAANLRYLFPLLLGAPVVFSRLWVAVASNSFKAISYPSSPWLSILLLLALATTMLPQLSSAKIAVTQWNNPYAVFLRQSIPDNVAVLTPYESEYLLGSRSLKAGNHWKSWASQLTFNGVPNPWDQGKAEFYTNQQTHQQRNYQALLIKTQDANVALEWFGLPSKRIINNALGVELWRFNDGLRSSPNRKVAESLASRFRVACK